MKEGDLIPNITLRSVDSDGVQNFNLFENFQNKKVLVICVPGAFTSTCHNQHLPPFVNNCDLLMLEKKIDLICCITTNDPFVLDLWRKEFQKSKIKFISDGNQNFMQTCKLIREYENSFMGKRLMRSIILVENLKILKILIDKPGELKKTSYNSVLNTI